MSVSHDKKLKYSSRYLWWSVWSRVLWVGQKRRTLNGFDPRSCYCKSRLTPSLPLPPQRIANSLYTPRIQRGLHALPSRDGCVGARVWRAAPTPLFLERADTFDWRPRRGLTAHAQTARPQPPVDEAFAGRLATATKRTALAGPPDPNHEWQWRARAQGTPLQKALASHHGHLRETKGESRALRKGSLEREGSKARGWVGGLGGLWGGGGGYKG